MSSEREGSYLSQLRYHIAVGTILFSVFLALGYWIAGELQIGLLEELGEVFGDMATIDPFSVMIIIFLNNSVKSFLALLAGIGFAIVPLLFVTLNGLLIGVILFEAVQISGVAFTVSAILPHGIIEIPVFLLSVAIGLRLGTLLFQKLTGSKVELMWELKRGLRFFAKWIVPLFLLAAFIEAFITPIFVIMVSLL